MSNFDFDDENDAITSASIGKLNLNIPKNQKTKPQNLLTMNNNFEESDERNLKNATTFNPNQISNASTHNNSLNPKNKPIRPLLTNNNDFNSNKNNHNNLNNFNDDGETPFQIKNKKTIFNPAINNNNDNFNNSINMTMQNENTDELSGFVNLNEEKKTFDPSKPYDPNEELPILEELGINPERIKEKVLSVVMIHKVNKQVLDDADMTGPFLIFIAFCLSLILQKKTHFGYIYGTTLFGGFIINTIMNLMSKKESILLYNTISVLGYCMIPIVLTSFIGLLINLKALVGLITCIASIIMASYTATNFFEEVLRMQSQKWLIFYPLILFYTSFLLVTMY